MTPEADSLRMLLTGCASGMGQHVADCCVAAGHRLIATDVDYDRLSDYAAKRGWREPQVYIERLNVCEPTRWDDVVRLAVERFAELDVLMNFAGVVTPGHVHDAPPEAISRHIDINAKGTMFGTQAAARQMVRQGHGHIINMGSMASLAPVPGIALYSASKFAVRGFSLAVAQELRPKGVFVTLVCPDAVQTPMLDLQVDYPEAALTFSGRRALTVEEVSRVILGRVLKRRPLEVIIPRSRGWLAKLTSAVPAMAAPLVPRLTSKGLARQAAVQKARNRPVQHDGATRGNASTEAR